MAYHSRGRDPLLDAATRAALEKRGRELIGLAFLAGAAALAAMLRTYAPDDPSIFAASDAPAQNALGRFGDRKSVV